MIDVLAGVAGAVIVLAVASDIFRSLLVPRASTRWLRLGPLMGQAIFPLWQRAADRLPGRDLRQTMRAVLAPLLLVLSLVFWAAMLIVGFGLIFWADRAGFTPRLHTLGDAIYAAGAAFSTLGVPGTVGGTLGRSITVVCSLAGLAIVTVIATFLISIQGGFSRRESLVLRLEAHVTLPPAGIAILETYAREGIVPRLGAFFDAWEEWAAEVAISHRAFPILVFFRSNDGRCEWLAALGAVLDAAALLDSTVAGAPLQARAGAHFVLRTGSRLLGDLAEQFDLEHGAKTDLVDPGRFDDHRARLAEADYDIVARQAALDRYVERRQSYAAELAALGHRLHIDVDERAAGEDDSSPMP